MTSFLMPTSWTGPAFSVLPSGLPESSIANPSLGNPNLDSPSLGSPSLEDEQFLLRAFRSFAAAATSLEHSYGTLRAEVERLRGELESRNADLEAAQAKLRREQALAEVSAVLVHEIRNLLGSLERFAGLLAEANLDSDCRSWVEHVQAGLRTLAATGNNILQFHSLPEPERAPVDLGQLLEWGRDFFLPLARPSRVAVSLQNRVSGILFSADRHRLEQLLLNLVLNALRALPGGGWVQLGGRTTPDGRAVVLTVTDTGPGISAEHFSAIFDPGFTTRAGSPGLGLAVCRKIVEQHGGSITAGNHTGGGAVFTVIFPLAEKCGGGSEP